MGSTLASQIQQRFYKKIREEKQVDQAWALAGKMSEKFLASAIERVCGETCHGVKWAGRCTKTTIVRQQVAASKGEGGISTNKRLNSIEECIRKLKNAYWKETASA